MKFSIAERRDMVIKDGVCSNAEQRGMLSIHRLGFYYIPQGISDVNPELIRLTDVYFIDHPHSGTITLCAYLCMTEGYSVNVKRVRRLMRLMGLLAVYPSKKLSIGNKAHKIYPYLLSGLKITRVWQTLDLKLAFMAAKSYLTKS